MMRQFLLVYLGSQKSSLSYSEIPQTLFIHFLMTLFY